MVKEGEFIDFASKLSVSKSISTTMQICVELSKKIIELENRIKTLELKYK